MDTSRKNALTILISDPDIASQHILVAALQPWHQTMTTAGFNATYQAIHAYHPQCLLLELDQPDGDGLAFIRYIHNDPATQSLIIACVTQQASIRDKAGAFQAGADDYIVKPINAATFAGRLGLLAHMSRLATWRSLPTTPDGYTAANVIDGSIASQPTRRR